MSTCRVVSGVCFVAMLLGAVSLAAEPKETEGAAGQFDPVRQFDHIGIWTAEEKPNERLVEASKVWVTDIEAHPFRVEWLRADDPARRKAPRAPHVAFRVDCIETASEGMKVLSKPFDAGIARVGFYETEDGAIVEFMEYYPAEGKEEAAKEVKPERPAMVFDHVGFITTEKKPGERFVEATRVWVTDIESHPFRVEWLRFEPDSPVTGPVREHPHVAFRVECIDTASKGLKVLLEPFDAGIAKVGFYQAEDGAVVEFMEYYKKPE